MVVVTLSLAAFRGCGQALQHHCCLACDPVHWWVTSPGLRHVSPAPAGKSPNHQESLPGFLPYFTVKNYKMPGVCSRENRGKISSPKDLEVGTPWLPGRICGAMSHYRRELNIPLDCSNSFLQISRMGAKAITSAPSHRV